MCIAGMGRREHVGIVWTISFDLPLVVDLVRKLPAVRFGCISP